MAFQDPGDFTAHTGLPAATMQKIADNQRGFNDGTAIADGAITHEHRQATILARAFLETAQNVTASTLTKVLLDGEDFDLGGDFDAANKRFVAPKTGFYRVDAQVQVNNVNALGNQALAYIYVDGVAVASSRDYATAANDDPNAQVHDVVFAEEGDFIELYCQQTSSATEALSNSSNVTYMTVEFAGEGELPA